MACVQDQINSSAVTGDFQLRRGAADNLLFAQRFTAGITGGICSAQIDLNKAGSPTGNIWAEIWSDNGSGVPLAQIGGISDALNVASLTGSHTFYTFNWSANNPSVLNGTNYFLVLNGNYTISSSDCAQIGTNGNTGFSELQGFDGTSWNTKTGNRARFSTSVDSTVTTTSTTTSTSSSTTTTSTSTSTSSTTTTSTSTTTTSTSSSTSSTTSTSTTISGTTSSTSTSTTTTSTSTSTTVTTSTSTTTTSTSTSTTMTTSTSTTTTTTYPYSFSIEDEAIDVNKIKFSVEKTTDA